MAAHDSNTDAQEGEKKARILIADDSKLVRVTATRILSSQFDLVLAEDGEEAWQKICADPSIQVVFTDLGMPKLDGYGLIERVRQSENEGIRNQPVIVITGAAEEDSVRRKVFEIGATDFITKPFKATEVVARADAHVSYRRDTESLQKSVSTDVLTGTLTRTGLDEQLEKDVSFTNRHNENLAVVVFEPDDFRTIYEKVGKQAAERIIKQIASTMLDAIRKEDSIGRCGLARFAIIVPMAKTEGVIMLAKRLCARVAAFKMAIGGEALPITLSAGIATASKGTHARAQDLFGTAEHALLNAEAVGPGEVQLLKLETDPRDEPVVTVSIDGLLETIHEGQSEAVEGQMEAVLSRLAPLVALMSEEQKQRLIDA